MTPQTSQVELILAAAVEIPTEAERQAYVAEACAGDTELQRQVEKMLENHFQAGSFLEMPAPGLPATVAMPMETAGQKIGHFTLLEKLGEGGMGTVWIAERDKPIRQRVALKLIKPGMDSVSVLKRFDAERQALALMSHNNIAKMLDAGTTETGRPYFVMELVKGVPITKYCDQVHSTVEERLRLFIPVCQAVQHAHQKGIIHRDIKPSNVLVCIEDGKPVPKVIDFGVAKALHQPLTDGTLHTGFNQVVGTLEYMSPEQAELNALDIDTRADIYALGVLLFELLTGSTPVTREELRQVALVGMLRQLKEVEPRKPSTRLSESKETMASLAAMRRTDPAKLMKEVRGDLDWIVLKCLEADRMRRYETINSLVRDVERHLAHEPVEAHGPSTIYRFKKFLKRNRLWMIAASLMLVAVVIGIVGLSWGMVEAERGRQLAEDKEKVAVNRLRQIEMGNDILGSIFLDLDPRSEMRDGKPLRVILGERLEKAAAKLQQDLIGDPVTVAKLKTTLGRSLLGLGFHKQAIPLLSQARNVLSDSLGREDPVTLECLYHLAVGYKDAGKYDLAIPLYQDALDKCKSRLGDGHADTIRNMIGLGMAYQLAGQPERAQLLLEEALNRSKTMLGLGNHLTFRAMSSLGFVYHLLAKPELALPLFVEARDLAFQQFGPESPNTIPVLINLATGYESSGKMDLAIQTNEKALNIAKAKLGIDHPSTLGIMQNIAAFYGATKQYDRAIPLLEQALKLTLVKQGIDHPATLACLFNLALTFDNAGRPERARVLYEETQIAMKQQLKNDNPALLECTVELARRYCTSNDQRALMYLQETVDCLNRQKAVPSIYKDVLVELSNGFESFRKYAQAEPWRRKLTGLVKERSGVESKEYAMHLAAIGFNLLRQEKNTEAELVLQECLTLRRKIEPDSWLTFFTMSLLGGGKFGQNKFAEAEPLLLQGYEGMKKRVDKNPKDINRHMAMTLNWLVQLCEKTGKPEEVRRWQIELNKLPTINTKPVAVP